MKDLLYSLALICAGGAIHAIYCSHLELNAEAARILRQREELTDKKEVSLSL